MRKWGYILLGVFSILLAQEANFVIQVNVEFVGMELKQLDGSEYAVWITDTLNPGDTAGMDSAGGIWIDNQSNVGVNVFALAHDDTVFCAPNSPWDVDFPAGEDTCAVGLAEYSAPRTPSISDAVWLDETIAGIETGIAPGEDRFGYIYFVAPTDSATYAERQHRIKVVIGVAAE